MESQTKRAQYPPANRFDLAYQETEDLLFGLEAELESLYGQAYDELKDKFADFLSQFEEDNKKKLEALANGEIDVHEYRRWRSVQLMTGRNWWATVETVANHLTNLNGIAYSIINGYLPHMYAINGNFVTYQIENHYHVDTAFTLYNEQAVERLIREKPDLLPRPKVDIPKDLRWNKNNINSAVMQGIIQGESTDALARRLANVSTMNKNQAVRIAATASTSAQNGGRHDAMIRARSMGIPCLKRWVATLDGHTRATHRAIDGDVVDIGKGEKFANGCAFPGDPSGAPAEVYNCRCNVIAAFEDSKWNGAEDRFSRIPEDMTYEEWKHAHGDEPFFKAAQNVNRDMSMYDEYKDLYKQYKGEFNAKIPKTFKEFQDLKYKDDFHWRRMVQDARRARNKKQQGG